MPFCRTFEAMQLAPTLRLGHGARMQRSSGAERLATTRPVLQRATLRDKAARIRSNTCCHALPSSTKLPDDLPGSSTFAATDLKSIRWLLCCTQMVVGAILCPLAWLLGAGWIKSAIISATYTLIAATVCYITLSPAKVLPGNRVAPAQAGAQSNQPRPNLPPSTQYNIAEASAKRRLVIGLVCFGTLVAGAFLGCGLWMLGVSVAWSAIIGAIHASILLFYGMTELWPWGL